MGKRMVGIIDYGAGNLRSLSNALEYLDIPYRIGDASDVTHLIIPGVGSYKYGMEHLPPVDTSKKILGICLGYQLLSEGSDEGGGTKGLGLIKGWVKKLPEPHVGWDEWEGNDYYFVHHYQNDSLPYAVKGLKPNTHIWGCQFHPEKSQEAGLQFLKEFCSL